MITQEFRIRRKESKHKHQFRHAKKVKRRATVEDEHNIILRPTKIREFSGMIVNVEKHRSTKNMS